MIISSLLAFIFSHWFIFGLAFVALAVLFFLTALFGKPETIGYKYKKRECVMTDSEHVMFNLLNELVGSRYYIFPQVHLPTVLDHKIKGQSWIGAFRHINQKSVDFVLCDKVKSSPILAIELDDRSHDRPDRQERDHEVERIFAGADMPLLRLKHGAFSSTDLLQRIDDSIATSTKKIIPNG